jgi:GrpB-like predicted nucleotidyltransferase (UPF0157 family)
MAARFHIRHIDGAILAAERDRALQLLTSVLPAVDPIEVGSTAVEGVIGKQDIDLALPVPRESFRTVRATLDRHFERDPVQFASDEYQAYVIPSELDVKVQLFLQGGPFDSFSAFVELLKSDPTLAEAYNALKSAWDGRPIKEYRQAKAQFIAEALAAPALRAAFRSDRGGDRS